MGTLLTIVQEALKDVGAQSIPDFVALNTSDPVAELCLSLTNRLGRQLAMGYDFEVLLKEHTFSTADGTASYDLPSDFRRFSRMTHWNRTQYETMIGPIKSATWQALQSGQVQAEIFQYFMLRGGSFYIYPTPSAVETIAYDYYSKNWCTDADSNGQAAFAADTDISLLDEELMILGLKARFLRSRGEPYDDEENDFRSFRDSIMVRDHGPGALHFDGMRLTNLAGNIPETGFGS